MRINLSFPMRSLPSPNPPPSSQPPQMEIEALRNIKSFSLLAIIGTLLIGVSSFSVLFGFLSFRPIGITAGIVTFFALFIIGAIILLISLFRLREGYSKLRNIDSRFGICYTGTTLIFIGLIIAIIGAILSIVLIGLPILILGSIIYLIGWILSLIVGAFQLNSRYQESLFLVAGILFIIGLFVQILLFIGVILLYEGTSSVIRRLGGTP